MATYEKNGIAEIDALVSGFFAYLVTGTGTISVVTSGADAVTSVESGTATRDNTIGAGADVQTQSNTGRAESARVGAGVARIEHVKTGAAISARSASGPETHAHVSTGSGISVRTGSGAAVRLLSAPVVWESSQAVYPKFRITGPCTDPYLSNATRGGTLRVVGVTVPGGSQMVIDHRLRRVYLDNQMVWGYTGTFFEVTPGDTLLTGASSIGSGFEVEINVPGVGGAISRLRRGAGEVPATGGGRPEISVSRTGSGALALTASGAANGKGRGQLAMTGGGVSAKSRAQT